MTPPNKRTEANPANGDAAGTKKRPLRPVGDGEDLRETIQAKGQAATRYSDTVAAERLAKTLKKSFCYCPEFGWMRWDGKVWSEVSETVVIEQARKLHKRWYTPAIGRAVLDNPSAAGPIKRLLSKAGLTSVVDLSRGLMHVEVRQFNRHRDLLNTASCVVDLTDGSVRKHAPDLYFTKCTAVGYEPDAEHDKWEAVLGALRPDAHDYMQVRCGQALTGYQPDDDKVCFLKGGGENGKTTFIGAMTTPLGSYYRQLSDKVLLADAKAHSTELTDLFGLRVAVIEELPEGSHLNAVLLKKITSPEITARKVYKDTMTFEATHSMFVTSNYSTAVAEVDRGTWRRLEQVVFPYTYVKQGGEDPRHRVGDPTLRDRVRSDPEVQRAALRWLVDGAMRWYANGKRMPQPPASIVEDTDRWRMRSDLVMRYWDEWLEPDPHAFISSSELLRHFNKWLANEGHTPWAAQKFSDRFGSHDLSEKVDGPRQVKASKTRTVSIPPDIGQDSGGHGERVAPFKAGKAWTGVRFRDGRSDGEPHR